MCESPPRQPAPTDVSDAVLSNGVRVLFEDIPWVHSAAVGVWVRTGSRDELPHESGVSHFLEHILFKGTTTRSAFDISYAVERVGGHIDAFTGRECTCFYARTLDRDLLGAVDVLCDMVSHPLIDPLHVGREKQVVLEEIAGVEDAPEDLIHDLLAEGLYPNHPLGWPVLGTRKSIAALTPEIIRAYWAERYTADRVLVTVAGQFDRDAVLARLEAGLELPVGGVSDRRTGPLPAPEARRWREDRELSQCYVCVGTRGVAVNDPLRPAALVLANVLGGGASSRLFQSIREQAGLAYSVYTYADACDDAGIFATSLGVREDAADSAVEMVREEYARLRRDGASVDEIEAAKAQIVAGILMALESTSDRMEHLAHSQMYHGRYMSADEQVALIEAVSPADVARAAERLLNFDATSIVRLGPPAAKVRPARKRATVVMPMAAPGSAVAAPAVPGPPLAVLPVPVPPAAHAAIASRRASS